MAVKIIEEQLVYGHILVMGSAKHTISLIAHYNFTDHPSCSKQHAVLQYRLVPYEKEDGTTSKRVRPYLLDMNSANGTFVNNKKIESKKYVELLEKDVIKFGFSSREYVLLHENSKDDDLDDDIGNEDIHVKVEGGT